MENRGLEFYNSPEPPCPLEGRRGRVEFFPKFVILAITTIAFFYRFIRTRDNTNLSWTPVLFYVAPLNFIFKYAVGTTCILLGYGIYQLNHARLQSAGKETPPVPSLTRSFRFLFGKAPSKTRSLSWASCSADQTRAPGPSKSQRIMGAVGSLVLIVLFLVQCAGTIRLYHRRLQNNAVAPFDERMLQIACGGLLVGILRICHTFPIPLFNQTVPNGDRTNLDAIALFFRDSCHEELTQRLVLVEGLPSVNCHVLRLLKNLTISGFLFLAFKLEPLPKFGGESLVRGLVTTDFANPLLGASVLYLTVALCGLFSGCVIIIQLASLEGFTEAFQMISRFRRRRAWLWLLKKLLLAVGSLIATFLMFTICFWIFSLLLLTAVAWCAQIVYDMGFSYTKDVSAYPIDVPCPSLTWADPEAEKVLWLA